MKSRFLLITVALCAAGTLVFGGLHGYEVIQAVSFIVILIITLALTIRG